MTDQTTPPATAEMGAPDAAKDVPVESGRQILINWIIVVLGLGALGALGAILPDVL